jgi:hypothetical protein
MATTSVQPVCGVEDPLASSGVTINGQSLRSIKEQRGGRIAGPNTEQEIPQK